MPKYQCPECEAILRRETAVPEGKKIKCPKCESLFKPKPMQEADDERDKVKKTVKAAPKSAAVDDEDDDEGGAYEVVSNKDEPKKKDVHYGSLRDKFKKSKRGPAMAKMCSLSNGMVLIGLATGVVGLLGVIAGLWPFIFSQPGEEPHGSRARNKILQILSCVFVFGYASCICYGGSKMHDLKSYGWSMAASIMTSICGIAVLAGTLIGGVATFNANDEEGNGLFQMVLFLIVGLLVAWSVFSCSVGFKSVARLREENIREGFEETREMRDY